ncbi:hypothetical protein CHS0354_016005 [Potamilus streckersoni]|uniref:Uncharacterized protein n=1 Tax=Potamilus streckersoni TaxID=2493646 RepID=A0AAE0W454_9BIVA|nr:hypothetical protein CHS0354_016005 [Potamilus streckersoni]
MVSETVTLPELIKLFLVRSKFCIERFSTTRGTVLCEKSSGPSRSARTARKADSYSNVTSEIVDHQHSVLNHIDRKAASRNFGKECTVVIDVNDVKKIKASEVIRSVEESTGDMSVYAVVPKG